MTGLSRRRFLQTTAAISAAFALPLSELGSALAAPLAPTKDAPSTLNATILQRSQGALNYRSLLPANGEDYIARSDLTRANPPAERLKNRRSLYYLGHTSDIHVIDAQAPARLDTLTAMDSSVFAGFTRPQDTLTVNVLAQMVAGFNKLSYSPVTGAPVNAVLNTGDNADNHSTLELSWYIKTFDGGAITPGSGAPGDYQGLQSWLDTAFVWHPEDPSGDAYGEYGFPRVPGLLNSAVGQTVQSEGFAVPWYTVFGNHDALMLGAFPVTDGLRQLALGGKKASTWQAMAPYYAGSAGTNTTAFGAFVNNITTQLGFREGWRDVASNQERLLGDRLSFMQAHFDTPSFPGPVGHGFAPENLSTGQTWWASDVGPRLRLIGLDTCNYTFGADGGVPESQFEWMKQQLEAATQQKKLVFIMSHHNSFTMENNAVPPFVPSERIVDGQEFIDTVLRYPNAIAWINGHTHNNTITAHPRPDGKGGFWEITTASCIDFPQQQQTIEIVDNRDGTLSMFATVVDHLSAPEWQPGDFSQAGLASLSRELASNDFTENPLLRRGSPADRNTELLLPAPFDLSVITDAEIEQLQMESRARITKHKAGTLG